MVCFLYFTGSKLRNPPRAPLLTRLIGIKIEFADLLDGMTAASAKQTVNLFKKLTVVALKKTQITAAIVLNSQIAVIAIGGSTHIL